MKYTIKKSRTKEAINNMVGKNFIKLAYEVTGKGKPVENYTQLAELIGIGQSNFAPIVSGTRNVPVERAIMACEVFGASIHWLITGQGDMWEERKPAKAPSEIQEMLEILRRMDKKKK